MNKFYRVIFTGLLTKEEHFKSRISVLGVSREDADKILEKAPVVLKEAESLEYIKKYARAITNAGGKVDIISWSSAGTLETEHAEIPGMSSFTQCTQCGYRQQKSKQCVRCGAVLTQAFQQKSL